MNETMLTTVEAAHYCGLSPRTLEKRRTKQAGPRFVKLGRLVKYRIAFAQRLGVTPAYVTKILRGRVNFTLPTMVRLSRALGSDLHPRLDSGCQRSRAEIRPRAASRVP